MEYNINNNNLSEVFSNIKKELDENLVTIKQLLKIDYKYCKMNISVETLKNMVDRLKNEKIEIQKEQKIMIEYNGNPYTTLNLSLLAILANTVIILECNQYMMGINNFIVKTVNDVLNKFKTNKLVYLSDKNNQEEIDKIICIDDINKYNTYLRKNNAKVGFYSLNYLDFYSESSEFENITDLIYKYAEDNLIPIESYSELEAEEAAKVMASGLGACAVILTNNEQTKQIFKNNITNKKIYINQNPFKEEIKLINKEILDI